MSRLVTRTDGGRTLVLDPVRRRYVALTPEEGVRQELLADLLALATRRASLAVEKGLAFGGKTWRADAVAYGRGGRVLLLAECKAPEVAVGQDTFDQLARYNAVLGALVLVVDNGRVRYCCVRGARAGRSWMPSRPSRTSTRSYGAASSSNGMPRSVSQSRTACA